MTPIDCNRCGKAKMLLTDSPRDAEQVADILRCRARGCREHWPNSKVSYHADNAGGAHGKDSNDK
jgi:hypothetical protein